MRWPASSNISCSLREIEGLSFAPPQPSPSHLKQKARSSPGLLLGITLPPWRRILRQNRSSSSRSRRRRRTSECPGFFLGLVVNLSDFLFPGFDLPVQFGDRGAFRPGGRSSGLRAGRWRKRYCPVPPGRPSSGPPKAPPAGCSSARRPAFPWNSNTDDGDALLDAALHLVKKLGHPLSSPSPVCSPSLLRLRLRYDRSNAAEARKLHVSGKDVKQGHLAGLTTLEPGFRKLLD